MRAICWGSGLDSSPLLRLACLQAGRRQHCQPRQVRKKAAVTAAAGCPAHKSRERGNVRGFCVFLGKKSPALLSMLVTRLHLTTGTALRAAIRSCLGREGSPFLQIAILSPTRFIKNAAVVRERCPLMAAVARHQGWIALRNDAARDRSLDAPAPSRHCVRRTGRTALRLRPGRQTARPICGKAPPEDNAPHERGPACP